MKTRKKLIEVALPLEAINKASAHEKQPGIRAAYIYGGRDGRWLRRARSFSRRWSTTRRPM
jgi:adenine-specific DNA methylase